MLVCLLCFVLFCCVVFCCVLLCFVMFCCVLFVCLFVCLRSLLHVNLGDTDTYFDILDIRRCCDFRKAICKGSKLALRFSMR